jgi:hypothetical protein
MNPWDGHKHKTGTKGSSMAEFQLRTIRVLDCLLITFFDYEGAVYHTFVPRGQTVNKEYYLEALKRLREAVRKKKNLIHGRKKWMLHHDNALARASLLIREFLAKKRNHGSGIIYVRARSRLCGLLSVSQAQIHPEGTTI